MCDGRGPSDLQVESDRMIPRCIACQQLIFRNRVNVEIGNKDGTNVQSFKIHERCTERFLEMLSLKEGMIEWEMIE